jgi:hypothetical protein
LRGFLVFSLLALAALTVWLLLPASAPDASEPPASPTPAVERPRREAIAEAPGADVDVTRAEVTPAPDSAVATEEVQPACTLAGSIYDPTGKPVRSPWIQVKDELGEERREKGDEAGSFSVGGLHPGSWWLYAGAKGYRTLVAVLGLDLARPILYRDFVLHPDERPRVKIRAQDLTGAPWRSSLEPAPGLSDLTVVATREPLDPLSPRRVALARRFGLGTFEALRGKRDDDALGVLTLSERPLLFVSLILGDAVIDTLPLEPDEDELLFVTPPQLFRDALASVRWRLVDAKSGEVLDKAPCSIHAGWVVPFLNAREDGWFQLKGLAPRMIRIRSRLSGYVSLDLEVALEPGRTTDLGSIPLEPETWIRGRVVGPDGEPAQAMIHISRTGLADRPIEGDVQWEVSEGRLWINGLERAEYVLVASEQQSPLLADGTRAGPRGISRSIVVSTLDGPVEDVVLQVEAPSLLVLLVEDPGCIGLGFRIVEASGFALRDGRFHQQGPTHVRLPPGPYTLELLSPEGLKWREQPITLSEVPLQIRIRR